METQLLKTVVGSQAHGLATPESDFDYRGVYIVPTSEFLKVGQPKTKGVHWIEGNEDDTSYEVHHFLSLAIRCNPTILEVLAAPYADGFVETEWTKELRGLLPKIWNARGVRDSFKGYGHNQRKKFLENKDKRSRKFAAAWLRTLYCGTTLLETGVLPVHVRDGAAGNDILRFKNEQYASFGEVVDKCLEWELRLDAAYEKVKDKETDLDAVNDFLIRLRKAHW